KIHLSSALKLKPTEDSLARLRAFGDDIYLHQVVIRHANGSLKRYIDLPETLEQAAKDRSMWGEEWRVHYHVPLHAEPEEGLESTADHLRDTLDLLAKDPWMCAHLEMETYTWEVLPESLRQ